MINDELKLDCVFRVCKFALQAHVEVPDLKDACTIRSSYTLFNVLARWRANSPNAFFKIACNFIMISYSTRDSDSILWTETENVLLAWRTWMKLLYAQEFGWKVNDASIFLYSSLYIYVQFDHFLLPCLSICVLCFEYFGVVCFLTIFPCVNWNGPKWSSRWTGLQQGLRKLLLKTGNYSLLAWNL